MVQITPSTETVCDERAKALLFALIAPRDSQWPEFKFAEMLRLWFSGDVGCLTAFLAWLDQHGLEIRKKQQ